jgi:hypothetical protein
MTTRYKRIDHVLGQLVSSDTLTEWEYNFVQSISKQFEDSKDLSDRQIEVMEKIYRDDQVRR